MKLIDFCLENAEKAGKFILKKTKKGFTVSEKFKNNLVTDADREVELMLKKAIKKTYPSHAVLGEESSFLDGDRKKPEQEFGTAEYLWIIDPIDGTTNFTRKMPFYCVSIAVFKTTRVKSSKNYNYLEGEIVAGVVHAPALGQTFHAEKGKGAYLNGKRIHVSNTKKLDHAVLSSGVSYNDRSHNINHLREMLRHCRAVRCLGTSALELCYTAMGMFDGHWEFALKAWDIAAGVLIVKEAGGKITDSNGNILDLFGEDIFASNKHIHAQGVKVFEKIE